MKVNKTERLNKILPGDILSKYEVYNYHHAAEILSLAYPNEFEEIVKALRNIDIVIDDITARGGSESAIPKKFKDIFNSDGWFETKITGNLNVIFSYTNGSKDHEEFPYNDYVSGYKIDFEKNSIAVDVEWNSKDQTFDRDLTAMRRYYELGLISLGVIITRGTDLKSFPKHYNLSTKYGASTTWMGKLTYRLDALRSGGCPILAIGITPENIRGYKPDPH